MPAHARRQARLTNMNKYGGKNMNKLVDNQTVFITDPGFATYSTFLYWIRDVFRTQHPRGRLGYKTHLKYLKYLKYVWRHFKKGGRCCYHFCFAHHGSARRGACSSRPVRPPRVLPYHAMHTTSNGV